MKNLFLLANVLFISFLLTNCSGSEQKEETATFTKEMAKARLDKITQKAIADLSKIPIDSNAIPRSLKEDGSLDARGSRNWTSGFYPGILWNLFDYSGQAALRDAAQQWTSFVEKEKWNTGTHDLGFMIYCPFGNAYRVTGKEAYKEAIIQAAKSLSTRYKPEVGALKSWDWNPEVWHFPVIIDNMMNLEMLFRVSEWTGDSTYYKIADQHAQTTMENHFRPDHSSYHVIDYDTLSGDVRNRHTHQGFAHESAWSRGQAWGLYGYTVAYRETGNEEYLEQARKIAHFIFSHPNVPEDKIPYWDYDAPNVPNELRDVSAATITASGLLELADLDKEHGESYQNWADGILLSLEQEKYQTDAAPFFLDHSVGSIPGKFEVDVPINYADYFYVEALQRRMEKP